MNILERSFTLNDLMQFCHTLTGNPFAWIAMGFLVYVIGGNLTRRLYLAQVLKEKKALCDNRKFTVTEIENAVIVRFTFPFSLFILGAHGLIKRSWNNHEALAAKMYERAFPKVPDIRVEEASVRVGEGHAWMPKYQAEAIQQAWYCCTCGSSYGFAHGDYRLHDAYPFEPHRRRCTTCLAKPLMGIVQVSELSNVISAAGTHRKLWACPKCDRVAAPEHRDLRGDADRRCNCIADPPYMRLKEVPFNLHREVPFHTAIDDVARADEIHNPKSWFCCHCFIEIPFDNDDYKNLSNGRLYPSFAGLWSFIRKCDSCSNKPTMAIVNRHEIAAIIASATTESVKMLWSCPNCNRVTYPRKGETNSVSTRRCVCAAKNHRSENSPLMRLRYTPFDPSTTIPPSSLVMQEAAPVTKGLRLVEKARFWYCQQCTIAVPVELSDGRVKICPSCPNGHGEMKLTTQEETEKLAHDPDVWYCDYCYAYDVASSISTLNYNLVQMRNRCFCHRHMAHMKLSNVPVRTDALGMPFPARTHAALFGFNAQEGTETT